MASSHVPPDLAAVRATVRSSSDPRVAATRSRLYDAVRDLARRGEDISVRSLAAAAGVSRATFYTHFSGLDDFALEVQEEAFRSIANDTRAAGADLAAISRSHRALIAHFAAFRTFYAATFRMAIPRGTGSRMEELMRAEILDHIRSATTPPPDLDPHIAATYIAHAATGVIAAWVLGELDATEDDLAGHLMCLMPAWMHSSAPASVGTSDGSTRKKQE